MDKKTFILLMVICFVGLSLSSCNQNEKKSLPGRLLLKNWTPKSIYKVPITHIRKPRYPAIDMHAHDYDTIKKNGLERRVSIMDSAGIQKSVIFTFATGKKFDSLYTRYSKYPDRFMVYCGIDYSGYKKKGWAQKAVKELKRDVKEGARGIGEMMDKHYLVPGMQPDDPRMDPIFETAANLGIPINIHVADPIWMYKQMDSTNDGLMRSWTWRVKNVNDVPSHKDMIKILSHTLERHPNTTLSWLILLI